jgi:hypothetical protein
MHRTMRGSGGLNISHARMTRAIGGPKSAAMSAAQTEITRQILCDPAAARRAGACAAFP